MSSSGLLLDELRGQRVPDVRDHDQRDDRDHSSFSVCRPGGGARSGSGPHDR